MSTAQTRRRKTGRRIAATILPLVLLFGSGVVAHAACLDDVQKLAESHGVPTEPPTATPHDKAAPGVTTEQLARSGGVIKPPPSADQSVIEPPKGQDPGMATVPGVKPQPGGRNPPEAPAAPGTQAGAERTSLQAALVAARADAERGDEKGCREQLAKAHAILSKGKM